MTTEGANTVDGRVVDDPPATRFTWTIKNFSRLSAKKLLEDINGIFDLLLLLLFVNFSILLAENEKILIHEHHAHLMLGMKAFLDLNINNVVDERILWIEISGLPLCAWGSNAYKKIACSFGKFLFFKKEDSSALSSGRVCISSKSHGLISENIQVEINNGSWCIKITDDYIDLSSNDNLKDVDTSSESIDNHSIDHLEYIQTNLNNIVNQVSEQKMDNNEENKTSAKKFRKKDIKGVSLIHELNQIIDVGNSLGYDVRVVERGKEENACGSKIFALNTIMARGRSGGLISMTRFLSSPYGEEDFSHSMHHHNGSYIMFGHMNAVRNEQERVGSIFNNIEADYFNSFIDATGLVDLLIGGRCFTWMNKAGTKLSKLNCFLISEDVIDFLPDIRITALDRIWWDHNPILLHVDKIDFGPSLFKLYNSWLLRDGFDDLIKSEWDSLDSNNSKFPIKCHEKFCILKDKIRQWNNNKKTMKRNRKAAALEELSVIEKKIDEGSASPSNTENRLNLLYELEIIDKFALMDLIQKARVKWDIEGDENTKFFHGLINQKRQNQMINGIMVEGNWITDLSLIKDAFFQFYKVKFQAKDSQVSFPNLPHSQTLNSMDRDYLERLVTHEEIKEEFGIVRSSKSPASILVNGSPTSEFSINHGLRQGDPLSPFLFILVMEGLHNAFADAVDDVIITTGWNARDLENIIRVLHVFYLASGLKINIHKSNIYGIGVNKDEVYNMASNAGWGHLTLIKSVLGSLGIYYLSIFRAPELVLNDLERIRSNFFWGGNQDGKKMAWVKWPIILNSYDNGGLNIGSLKAFNLALLQK
ncbi:RNA-directed DNA polymerase, eukaryota, reverse transcriptase zinc-binding domain protein [Tanacetum coccineum]